MHRERILQFVGRELPLAAALANWSIGNEGKLFCAGATLSSSRGVQQTH